MRKKFTKLLAAFALLVFMTPTMVGWGQTTNPDVTYDFTASGWVVKNAVSTDIDTLTNGTVSFTGRGGDNFKMNSGYFILGKSGAYLNFPTYASNVSKIVITGRNNASGSVKQNIYVGTTAVSTETTGATGTNTYEIASSYQTAGTQYTLKVTSAHNTQITKIEIYYASSGGGTTVATPQISHATDTYYGTQFVTISCGTTDANIYYTMGENPDEPTSSSTPYTGAIQVAETTTIKAIAVKDGMQDSGVATSTLTILPAGFDQDWEGTMDGWKFVSVSGDQTWTVSTYNNNKFAKISGYANSTNNANEDWIISPAFNLGNYSNPVLTFTSARNNQNGNALEVYFSNDYAGGTNANPTWTKLTCTLPSKPSSGYTDFTSSGDISLSSYSGANCYIGFKYTSTTSAAVTWEVDDIELFSAQPTITVTPNSLSGFTYIETQGPSAAQTISVSGTYLEENLGLSLGQSSDFEMSLAQNNGYTNSLTLNQTSGAVASTTIYVRMKGDLAAGNHSGTITLTSTNADDKTVSLSGTVTGQTFTITDASGENGEITFSPASPVEAGTHVALTANATNPAYYFVPGSWSFFDENDQEVTDQIEFAAGEENTIVMPAYNLQVDATFSMKPKFAVACVYDDQKGELIADPSEAYEGQTVTLSYDTETGYSLSSIVITKTSDGSATGITLTASGDDFTFTMPGYAVTATANFVSNTYEGNFALFSGSLTEGDYILVYNNQAMNDTLSNKNKFGVTGVSAIENVITNPSRAIVWHIAPSNSTGYWTIYSAAMNKYVGGTQGDTNVSFDSDTTANNNWAVSGTYDFRCKANEGQSTARYLRNNNGVYGNYASGNGGALTLYKYTVLTQRIITFNGNGGTYNDAQTYTQDVYDGIEATLDPNHFTRSGYEFSGWNTESTGVNGTAYADEAEITVTGGDLTLYAQWVQSYTATVDGQISGGSVVIDDGSANGVSSISVAAGATVSLIATPASGHAFGTWNVYKESDQTTTVTVENNAFTMPAYNVVISASFVEAVTYSLVTNENPLVSGKHYIIASGTTGTVRAMGAQSDNNRAAVVVNVDSNGHIPETTGVSEFVIIGPDVDGFYTIYDVNENKYLYAAGTGSKKNYLRSQEPNDNNGRWTIKLGDDNNDTIKAQGSNTNNWMRYNSSSTLFSCYGSGQGNVYLFAKDNETTVSYTMNISGYDDVDDKDGYYLIAPPVGQVTPTVGNNLLAVDYDLYAFDQSQDGAEWRNYEANSFFNLVSGRGYLYANSNDVELTFEGYPYVGNGQVFLSYTEGNQFEGFNLIGNPFATTAYLADGRDFYRMKDDGSGFIINTSSVMGHAVAAYEGIFVIAADEDDNSVTFQTTDPSLSTGTGNNSIINMTISHTQVTRGEAAVIDAARIRINNGGNLLKFVFNESTSRVYIPQNGKDYAVVNAEAQGEMPVNFKAAENGTYTISVDVENLDMDYLHLIDNMTGENVNLLVTPSYTFQARTTDYASRFRLVFSANANENGNQDDNFAFLSDGNIVIVNEGEATLQVIDMLGRVVSSQSVNGNASVEAASAPGVYVLRLINGNNVKTQRIVVR